MRERKSAEVEVKEEKKKNNEGRIEIRNHTTEGSLIRGDWAKSRAACVPESPFFCSLSNLLEVASKRIILCSRVEDKGDNETV